MFLLKALLGFIFITPAPAIITIPPIEIATTTPIIESIIIATTTEKYIEPDECSCVKIARKYGLKISGDAKDLRPNGTPMVGGGILLRYPDKNNLKKVIDHVAVILEIRDRSFFVIEGNFKPCEISTREILFTDKFIKGFIVK